MAQLILPDSRLEMPELLHPGRKPVGNVEVDWSHPLSRGLVRVFVSPGEMVVGTTAYGSGSWEPRLGGLLTTDVGYGHDDLSLTGHSKFTVFCISQCKPEAASGFDVRIGGLNGENGSQYNSLLMDYYGTDWSGNHPDFHSKMRVGASVDVRTLSFSVDDKYAPLCFAWSGGDGYERLLAGNSYAEYTKSGDVWSNTEIGLVIGKDFNSSSYYSRDTIHHAIYIFNRALSESQLRDLQRNPYQFLVPA